jgi:hypothetical protein
MQVEVADIVPDELRTYSADEVLVEMEQMIALREMRRRLGAD